MKITISAAVLAAFLLPEAAFADDVAPFPCGSIEAAKRMADSDHSGWVELAPAQWNFLRGVFVEAPDTPPSLPPGDRAAMSRHSDGSASIVFLDGDRACAPIRINADMLAMIMAVGRGDVVHAGDGL